MPVGRLARYALFAALISISILTYLREQEAPTQTTRPAPVPGIDRGAQQSTAKADKELLPAGSGFDIYVLALSWSPSYCAAEGAKANRQQCNSGRPYGFVVHGLWPQFEQGYPQDCDTAQPRDVPYSLARQLSDIMPSTGLVTYEWRKHGACSGLGQQDYFSVMRQAMNRVSIPSAYRQPDLRPEINPLALEQAFVSQMPACRRTG
ncbi:MAG: ribonuclease [Phyllobacterium sp.]|uniref:ribonuclease T2 family protein n=1 Tax=Phyllobacterium sp. TaxID=1871046 RepID=UPI0030F01FEE